LISKTIKKTKTKRNKYFMPKAQIYVCKWCELRIDFLKDKEVCKNTFMPHDFLLFDEWKRWRKSLTDEQYYRLLRIERIG
jgi:hypothetical protein